MVFEENLRGGGSLRKSLHRKYLYFFYENGSRNFFSRNFFLFIQLNCFHDFLILFLIFDLIWIFREVYRSLWGFLIRSNAILLNTKCTKRLILVRIQYGSKTPNVRKYFLNENLEDSSKGKSYESSRQNFPYK